MGVSLLKQDVNGNFKRLNIMENTNSSGGPIFYSSNNCQ